MGCNQSQTNQLTTTIEHHEDEKQNISDPLLIENYHKPGNPPNMIRIYSQADHLRRFWRIIILLIALGTIVIIPYSKLPYMKHQSLVMSSLPLTIHHTNCTLIFQQDDSIIDGKLYAKTYAPRQLSSHQTSNNSAFVITAAKANGITDSCKTIISISKATILSGGINYLCEGVCSIVHKGPHTLDFGLSNLTIYGNEVAINFQTIKANKLM